MRYDKIDAKRFIHHMYMPIMNERGRNLMTPHYTTARFNELKDWQRGQLTNIRHTWKLGDRYYKLAQTYYSSPEAWWVIALYNGRPTEGHIAMGTTIYIPTPLGKVLAYYGF